MFDDSVHKVLGFDLRYLTEGKGRRNEDKLLPRSVLLQVWGVRSGRLLIVRRTPALQSAVLYNLNLHSI